MLTWIADGVNDTISAVATTLGELAETAPSLLGCIGDPMLTDFPEAERQREGASEEAYAVEFILDESPPEAGRCSTGGHWGMASEEDYEDFEGELILDEPPPDFRSPGRSSLGGGDPAAAAAVLAGAPEADFAEAGRRRGTCSEEACAEEFARDESPPEIGRSSTVYAEELILDEAPPEVGRYSTGGDDPAATATTAQVSALESGPRPRPAAITTSPAAAAWDAFLVEAPTKPSDQTDAMLENAPTKRSDESDGRSSAAPERVSDARGAKAAAALGGTPSACPAPFAAQVPTPSTRATSASGGSPARADLDSDVAAAPGEAYLLSPEGRMRPTRVPRSWPPTPTPGSEPELWRSLSVLSPQQAQGDVPDVQDSLSSPIQGLLERRSLTLRCISLETYITLEGRTLRLYDEFQRGKRNLLCDCRLSGDFEIQRTSETTWRVVAPPGSRQEHELAFELCAPSASDADTWEGHLRRACQV